MTIQEVVSDVMIISRETKEFTSVEESTVDETNRPSYGGSSIS